MSTKAGGSDDLFLFTYANHLLLRHGFRLNIQYLFIYLFKAMSTKAGGTDHLYLLTPITCCENMLFSLNIQYLFIYLFKTMSTKAGGSDHLF